MSRQRASTGWRPQWDDKIQKWTQNFLRQHHWRCDRIHGVDDLMQDAYLLFLKVRDSYPRINKASDFNKLYKAAVRNSLHDHARTMMKKHLALVEVSEDAFSFYSDRIVGEVTNNGFLLAAINEAPEEIAMALALLSQNPEAVRTEGGDERENLNQKIRRLLGLDFNFDFSGELRELLSKD